MQKSATVEKLLLVYEISYLHSISEKNTVLLKSVNYDID